MATETWIFFMASDPLGSRYLLFPFHCCADRLAEVTYLVQGHITGNWLCRDLNLVVSPKSRSSHFTLWLCTVPDITSSSSSWGKGTDLCFPLRSPDVSYRLGGREGRFVPTLLSGPGNVPSQINSWISECVAVVPVVPPALSSEGWSNFSGWPQERHHTPSFRGISGYLLACELFGTWGLVFLVEISEG